MAIEDNTKGSSSSRMGEIVVHPDVLKEAFNEKMRHGIAALYSDENREQIIDTLDSILSNFTPTEENPSRALTTKEYTQLINLDKQTGLVRRFEPLAALQGVGKEDSLRRREESILFNSKHIRDLSGFIGTLRANERPSYKTLENFRTAYTELEPVLMVTLFPDPERD